jgi:hypothetical protein
MAGTRSGDVISNRSPAGLPSIAHLPRGTTPPWFRSPNPRRPRHTNVGHRGWGPLGVMVKHSSWRTHPPWPPTLCNSQHIQWPQDSQWPLDEPRTWIISLHPIELVSVVRIVGLQLVRNYRPFESQCPIAARRLLGLGPNLSPNGNDLPIRMQSQ